MNKLDQTIRELGRDVKLSNGVLTRVDTDDEHFYFITNPDLNLNGVFCSSVTQVLDLGAPFPVGLRDWLRRTDAQESIELFESRGARGSKLHDALERLINAIPIKSDDYKTDYEKKAIATFIRFMQFLKPYRFVSEFTVVDPTIRNAGTVDFKGIVDERRLNMLLDPKKYLDIDDNGNFIPKPNFKHMIEGAPVYIKIIIDWKFTGRTAYNHKVQVAGYAKMNELSYAGEQPVKRKFTWRFSPNHKYKFDFSESKLEYKSFLRIHETFMEYVSLTTPGLLDENGFLKPPEIEVYPEEFRLFEKAPPQLIEEGGKIIDPKTRKEIKQ